MPVTADPGFDPYALLGVRVDADEFVIQLAYRARIRGAHPDVAGPAGLEHAKQLNIARDWLLDPERRAQLPRSRAAEPAAPSSSAPAGPGRRRSGHRNGAAPSAHIDPSGYDFGVRTGELRAFLRSVAQLTPDERARVNYSIGDGRVLDFETYRDYLPPELWTSSQVLREAVGQAWRTGVDEKAPHVPMLGHLLPSGVLVANAFAQWLLLGDYFRAELGTGVFRGEDVVDAFTARCVEPWQASVGQPRYGPYDDQVRAFLTAAAALEGDAAGRLAQSWQKEG